MAAKFIILVCLTFRHFNYFKTEACYRQLLINALQYGFNPQQFFASKPLRYFN